MELHWTLVLHSALISDTPIEQLKLARYIYSIIPTSNITRNDWFFCSTKLAAALESISEVLLKLSDKRQQSTDLILQHLILVLRHKYELVQTLLAEEECTVESFHWKSQLQYSTEVEDLYSLPGPAMKKLTDGSQLVSSSTQANFKLGRSPVIQSTSSRFRQQSNSLVASSRSLLNSRNAGNTSFSRSHDFSQSPMTPAYHRSMGGCASPLKCFVHCHKTTLPYGFEFLGSEAHVFLTPQTESTLLSLVSAMSSHECPSISYASSGRTAIGKDLAVVSWKQLINYKFLFFFAGSWSTPACGGLLRTHRFSSSSSTALWSPSCWLSPSN